MLFSFFYDIEVLVNLVGLLAEGNVHQGKVVFEFHVGVAVHSRAALAVQSGGVEVDLDLAHHIDVGLAGQLGGGLLVEWDVHVVVLFLVIDGDLAVDAAGFDEVPDFFVIEAGSGRGDFETEIESCALNDVVGQANEGGDDFLVGLLRAAGLGGDVVDVRDAFRADGDLFHGQAAEVADAAAEAAVQDEGVLDALEFVGDLGVDDFLEFFLTQEDRTVVHRVHHGTFLLRGEAAEGGLHDFVRLLQLVEEGLEILHRVDHGVDGGAVGRVAAGSALLFNLVELGVLLHVQVFIEDELPVLQQEVGVELGDGDFGKAFNGEETLEFVRLADDHLVAFHSDDPVTAGFIGKADKALAEGFGGGGTDFDDGIEDLVNLFLQDIGSHVHSLGLHQGVGFGHGGEVGVQLCLQLLVVDGDFGLEGAFRSELFQVLYLGADAGLVIQRNVPSIDETESNPKGVTLGGGPVIHRNSFHKSLILFYVQI